MKKLIVLTAVTTILITGSQGKAWAGNKADQENDDYRTFRKIVRVLDDLINDDYRRGRRTVVVREYHFPNRKVCYFRGPYEVCQRPHSKSHKNQKQSRRWGYGRR